MKLLNQIKQVPDIFRLYKNPLAYYLDKFSRDRKSIKVIQLRNGLKFRVRGGNSEINSINEVFLSEGHKEFAKLSGEAFVDIGANIGLVSIGASRRYADVYSFEPNEKAMEELELNRKMNFATDMYVFNRAVGPGDGTVVLHTQDNDWGSSKLADGKEFIAKMMGINTIAKIVGKNFDVKIDVEGMEWEIINAMTRETADKIDNLFVEIHEGVSVSGIIHKLIGLGFKYVNMFDCPYSILFRK